MKLANARVLVVEDEMLVAMTVEDALTAHGVEVVGPAMRLETALAMVDTATIDAAILDISLHGDRSYPVAQKLRDRGIPFVFATGYGHAEGIEAFADVATLAKPYRIDDLIEAVTRLLGDG